MTTDTTFKEFLAEKGVSLARLAYNSEEYRDLARQFNEAKFQLIQEKQKTEGDEEEEMSRTEDEEDL